MEALEELAVSYERQDSEIEASNQEKVALQTEVEQLQVNQTISHVALKLVEIFCTICDAILQNFQIIVSY